MTHADRFMRTSIRRRFSLTTLLQVSGTMRDMTDAQMEERFHELNELLASCPTEQEFCRKAFQFKDRSEELPPKSRDAVRIIS